MGCRGDTQQGQAQKLHKCLRHNRALLLAGFAFGEMWPRYVHQGVNAVLIFGSLPILLPQALVQQVALALGYGQVSDGVGEGGLGVVKLSGQAGNLSLG